MESVGDVFKVTTKSDGDTQMKHAMCDGGEHKVHLLSTRNHTPTHVHLPQGNCSVVSDPVVGSGEPYSPTTSSAGPVCPA